MPGLSLSANSAIRNQCVRLLLCALHETWTRLVLLSVSSLAHQCLLRSFNT
jgi:hypothetical protein